MLEVGVQRLPIGGFVSGIAVIVDANKIKWRPIDGFPGSRGIGKLPMKRFPDNDGSLSQKIVQALIERPLLQRTFQQAPGLHKRIHALKSSVAINQPPHKEGQLTANHKNDLWRLLAQ